MGRSNFQTPKQQKTTCHKNRHTIETYIEAKERELKQQGDISDNKGYNNLSKGETTAMKELHDRTDIIITKDNKGGAVAIMDVKDYINEAHCQLNNKDCYKNWIKTLQQLMLGPESLKVTHGYCKCVTYIYKILSTELPPYLYKIVPALRRSHYNTGCFKALCKTDLFQTPFLLLSISLINWSVM